jgi:hypothetical protein
MCRGRLAGRMLEEFGKRHSDGRDVQRDLQYHRMALLRVAANSIVKYVTADTRRPRAGQNRSLFVSRRGQLSG